MNDSCDQCDCEHFQCPTSWTISCTPVLPGSDCDCLQRNPPDVLTITSGDLESTYANPHLNDKGQWEYDFVQPAVSR